MCKNLVYLTSVLLVLLVAAGAQAKIVYIDATEGEGGNTALAAGGVFTSTADGSGADNLWRGRAFGNGATIFESGGAYGDTVNTEDCPELVTTVSVPEDDYEVFVYFWADGSQWRILAALADAAELPLFKANDPNGVATIAVDKDFSGAVPMLLEGNRTLWQVSLGTTGLTTTISVFIDDEANHLSNNARTWYDGIGVKALPRTITYVDATEGETGNTALAAGGVFTSTQDGSGSDNLWRGRAFANGGTIFESGGAYGDTANPEDCPRLVTTVTVPENEYAVYAYFWSDGGQWRIEASLTDVLDLPLFLANDPNGPAKMADANDFAVPVPMVGPDGNRYLWQVFLGNTGSTTSISVFVDDEANHQTHNARTWYDGIGYKVITPIHYVDATAGDTGNTRLTTGDVLLAPDNGTAGSGADGQWRERAFGNGTIYEARGSWDGNNSEDAPRLVTTVDVPENIYEVFAYYWDTNSTWRMAASLTDDPNQLPVFVPNHDEDPNNPCVAADAADFAAAVPIVATADGRVMWQIPLGMTGVTTKITVYVDDDISTDNDPANGGGNCRTWYDGIGYKVASLYTPEAAPAPSGPVKPDASVDPGVAGLVAYYAFEGNTDDLSGNGLNGTIAGAPTFVSGAAGLGQALDFHADPNGAAGDSVDCGNSPLFDFVDAMTVGAWVNIRSIPDEYRNIVSKGNSAWLLGTDGTSTGFQWMFAGARGWLGANSKTKVPMNEWHYVCGTYDKAGGGATIYVDGELEATRADTTGVDVDSTMNVWIGANSDFGEGMYKPGRYFDGMIDEVKLYDRALSWAEVMFLAGQ